MKNPTFSRVKIYCHSKVNYPDIFFKVFHNIEKKITAVISKLPWNLITAVNCLITQAPVELYFSQGVKVQLLHLL
jgi:hypothetical protein